MLRQQPGLPASPHERYILNTAGRQIGSLSGERPHLTPPLPSHYVLRRLGAARRLRLPLGGTVNASTSIPDPSPPPANGSATQALIDHVRRGRRISHAHLQRRQGDGEVATRCARRAEHSTFP